MKPNPLMTGSMVALVSLCAPASAFELGSCLILHVSDTSSEQLEKVSIQVEKKIFKSEAAPKTKTIAKSAFVSGDSAEGFGATETEFSAVGTSSSFSFETSDSVFDTTSFDTSAFKLD